MEANLLDLVWKLKQNSPASFFFVNAHNKVVDLSVPKKLCALILKQLSNMVIESKAKIPYFIIFFLFKLKKKA